MENNNFIFKSICPGMGEDAILPFVSILIPAYHQDFFKEALFSALNQSYSNIEIIICNDNPSSQIRHILEEMGDRKMITYFEHPKNVGAALNYLKCFELAKGEYIKFLNDDDLLMPDCIKKMVSYFETFGERITLVTSKRNKIDSFGRKLKDDISSALLVRSDALIDGKDLGNLILRHHVNMLGEPTTPMFRKKDLMDLKPHIFSINGKECYVLVDIVMWLNLLSKGDAIYISEPLSSFRIHGAQDQKNPKLLYQCYAAWPHILNGAKSIGFLENAQDYIQAIKTFSRVCQSWEEKPMFTEPQRDSFVKLRLDLESEIPALEKEVTNFSEKKKGFLKYAKELKRIQRHAGWDGPFKYVFVQGNA